MKRSKPVIAIGPERDRATWTWVGLGLYRELSRFYQVKVFQDVRRFPSADVVVNIKERLSPPLKKHPPIVYLPCDFYLSRDHISRDPYLPYVTAVVAHSQRLARCLQDFHERVFYLDHDCRYLLPKMQPYRTEGPLLWVGYTGNLPYLARWLSEHSLPSQLMVLTDQPGRVPLPDAVQEIWTPRRQQEYLRFARAALDIKGVSFNQEMRPPEKLEMFLSNGIPSACNPESSLFNHFREDGFQIVDPADHTRWFSAEYHEETCAYAKVLRRRLDVGTVGKRMRSILETLL